MAYPLARLTNKNGYAVDIRFKSVEDTLERAIAEYAPPYADGILTDDLGAHPRKIRFEAIFRGAEYDAHMGFLEALTTYNQTWELHHPAYADIINGRIKSARVAHDKGMRNCGISIEFVESVDDGSMSSFINVNQAESLAVGAASDAAADMAQHAADQATSNPGWYAQLDAKVQALEALATSIAAPVNAIAGKIRHATGIPGRLAGAVCKVLEAVLASADAIANTPEMISSMAFQIDYAKNIIENILQTPDNLTQNFDASMTAIYASFGATYAGRALKEEQEARQAVLTTEGIPQFNYEGGYTAPGFTFDGSPKDSSEENEILSTDELDLIFLSLAGLINSAITLLRANALENAATDTATARHIDADAIIRPLAAQAKLLHDYIETMIVQTGNVYSVETGADMPIFILMQREGLPYMAADRVHALNSGVINPIFYTGEVRIYDK